MFILTLPNLNPPQTKGHGQGFLSFAQSFIHSSQKRAPQFSHSYGLSKTSLHIVHLINSSINVILSKFNIRDLSIPVFFVKKEGDLSSFSWIDIFIFIYFIFKCSI